MNRDVDPESVVARRELTVDGRDVTLLVGAARPFADDEPDVFCPFRLEEADGTEIWSAVAGGVDTAQAVLLALTGAGERLAAHDGEVTFFGSRELGLPRISTSGAGWTASFSHGLDRPDATSDSLPR